MKLVVSLCFIALASANPSEFFLGALHGSETTVQDYNTDCNFTPSSGPVGLRGSYIKYVEQVIGDVLNYAETCGYLDASETIKSFMTFSENEIEETYKRVESNFDVEKLLVKASDEYDDGDYFSAGQTFGGLLNKMLATSGPTIMRFVEEDLIVTQAEGTALPLAIFHGLGDQCINPGMSQITKHLGTKLGSYVACVEIGNGMVTSILDGFVDQAEKACKAVQSNPKFANGLNTLGLSHGSLIGRYIAESCEGVTVHKWVSIGGPNQGVATFPNCHSGWICDIFNDIIKMGVYSDIAQKHIGPAGYFKDPYHLDEYVKQNHFLPPLNNHPTVADASRKTRLAALDRAVLVRFTEDTVVDPTYSEWFGEYTADQHKEITHRNDTDLYKDDWIGLKELAEAGKVTEFAWKGNHLQFTMTTLDTDVVPLLMD